MIRLGFILTLVALVGALVSGLAAYRVFDQERSIDRIALSRAIDIHAGLVEDRLAERELLVRVAVSLFRSPSLARVNTLEPLRSSIDAFKTDFVLAGWIVPILPADIPTAERDLRLAGFPDPVVRNSNGTPLTQPPAGQPLDVLMDVEPRTPETITLPGRVVGQAPAVRQMLERAAAKREPIASEPIVSLLHRNGSPGIVLSAPVIRQDNDSVAGFVTFSFRLAPLMLANHEVSLFSVVLRDPRQPGTELVADLDGVVTSRPVQIDPQVPPVLRTLEFGGRDWTLAYYPKTNPLARPFQLGAIVGVIGLAVTAILCGLFGYVTLNNLRLAREVQTRIDYEHRLTAVIDELNHRVKNILAVIQSIVTRTLRHGSDMDTARDLLVGRIHAMSNVVTLLSESKWQGVKLKGLFDPRAFPRADRIDADGPDIAVSARAAQSLSLLFFELASHADEGHSLVGNHPRVVARWSLTSEQPTLFHFRWEEFNTSEATRRPDSDFAVTLLDRVAPEALGGSARRYFTDVSYVYELSAPLETVIDPTERLRTERISKPVQRRV